MEKRWTDAYTKVFHLQYLLKEDNQNDTTMPCKLYKGLLMSYYTLLYLFFSLFWSHLTINNIFNSVILIYV